MAEGTRYFKVAIQLSEEQPGAALRVLNLGSVMIGLQQHSMRFPKELVYWAAKHCAPSRAAAGPWYLPHLISSEPLH